MGFQDALDDIGNVIEAAATENRFLTPDEERYIIKLARDARVLYEREGWISP